MRAAPSPRFLSALALTLSLFAAPLAGEAHAVGILVPTQPDLPPLAVRYHRVHVDVRERIAETRVEQAFFNSTSSTLEATYIFPVPRGATVSGFAMWVNGQRVEGELLDAATARGVYESIVARMRDPGLVEHIGGNLFRARVFPIAPMSEQRIEITFTETLEYQNGVVHYRYPLRTTGAASRTLQDLTIAADVVSRTPIRAVYSPTHPIAVARDGDRHVTASFEAHGATLDTDFDLYYAVADGDVGLSLLTHREAGDEGYFLAMIAPRTELTEAAIAAKEVIFVVDTSGSMSGEKLQRAQAALDHMLSRLSPTDYFQVVRFSTDVEAVFDAGRSVQATPEHVARARRAASRFVAAGGTAIHPALSEALRTRPPATAMPRMIVFLTDGMPTVGQTDPAQIVTDVTARVRGTGVSSTRLFVFGVGDDVNTTFLDSLAQANGGVGDYFRDGSELQTRMTAFYDRIAYPVLVDLHLSMPGASAFDVYPRDLGNLYRGGQVLVVGRYRGEGAGRVVLEGRLGHESAPREFAFDVSFPREELRNEFLPRVWAVRKVGTLLDEIRLAGERPELRDEVVTLARRFGIVTPYTSYLVAEDRELAGVRLPQTTEAPPPPDVSLDSAPLARGGETASAQDEAAPERDFGGFAQATVQPPPRSESTSTGSSGGSSGAGATATAQPPPPPVAMAPEGGTGESGRRLSARLHTMREAERADDGEASGTQFVGGRAFRLVSGTWVDSRFRTGMRELRVRYGSSAYFTLLRERPALAPVLALGERLVAAIDDTRAIIVDPAAADLADEQVRAYLSH